MDLFMKKEPTKEEYILVQTLCIFGMKKLAPEKVQKLQQSDDIKDKLKEFFTNSVFMFGIQEGSEKVSYTVEVPSLDKIKKKIVLIIKAKNDRGGADITDQNIATEVIMMELNRQILENLYNICQEVYLPVMRNPLNQIGLSDLVSKDLMDKFHNFLDHTYVTIGQSKGRTWLPVPAQDVTSSDRTSSKDKAHILEGAIITWTKQIKNVLKKDPESELKNGNHPDPLTELQFWKDKSDDLNSIWEQLNSEKIKKVLKFLEQNKSTYTAPFSKLQKDVNTAKKEANDNYKYLQTLSELFKSLTDYGGEFVELQDLFVPIMHVILLIYTYSPNYNTPSRLVVLIREICNAIINQCKNYIDGDKIFGFIRNEEPKEAHEKLIHALDICSKFKDAYFEYKAKAKNQWKITTNALFVRLDSFSERCQDIMHLTSTIIQFNKLQKIEIGNTKGKQLTASVLQIFDEFNKAVSDFMTVSYDIIDIERREFDDDFYKFRCRIKELERRLGSILTQGFDDSDTIIGKFKLLDSFEGLLNRPIIQDELEKKHITLLELYKADLKTVQSIFLEGKGLVDKIDDRAPIANNLPPISGALNWTAGLLERIKEPMDRLSQLSQSIQDREEFKDVQKLYASLCKNLREFEDQKIKQWEQGVEENTEEKLNQFLLVREETELAEEGFLKVNFDPVLVRMLREVKYLQLSNIKVPERAENLFKKVNIYRSQTGNLELIVNMYNDILATLLPVEKPLLADRIEKINKNIQPGIDTLKWNTENINPFIKQNMEIVKDVDDLVKKMKENVRKMYELMAKWEKPLFERKMKPMLPDDLEQMHTALVMPRLEDIKNHGKEIHKLMKDTGDNIKPDKKGRAWLSYVDYLNGLLIEGITKGIMCSLSYLSDQINIQYNKHHQYPPMFDVKVDLRDREVKFDPPIESNNKNGIRDIIVKIINDFISISICMPRLDTNNGDYLVEIKDQFELFGQFQVVENHLNEIEKATFSFIKQYEGQEFLWKETLASNFQAFIDQGEDPREIVHKKLNADGEEEEDETFKWMADKILEGVQTKKPNLELFDEKITHLTKVKHQISEMKTTVDIGWLRVNSSPLIRELQKTITEWIEAYTSFLLNNTVNEISNIQKFIDEVTHGIKVLPEQAETKKEKELLMQVMTHLRDVKMIKDRTLDEVEPMKQTIMLLKKHQVKMDEDFLVKLENSKTALAEVSEKALGPVKEAILPLQNQEAGNIKKQLSDFSRKINEYRVTFQQNLPYHLDDSSQEVINSAYQSISDYYGQTCDLEEEAKKLNNLETLFDLQKSSYKQLKDCKNELLQLKYMWDLISLVDMQFEAWKLTLWDKIDTEELMQLIKEMQTKQTNPQNPSNKEIKTWKAFTGLNERVRNMNTILPLISQLHSKFMMERHWRKLERITQKPIKFNSPNFCLDDLIKLQLYKYSEEVTELVDSAQKESKIENNLNRIEKVWEEQLFEFKEYKDTCILGALDEIVEFVETHQMELMGMLSSKDVAEFEDKVKHWQKTLKQVDSVIQIWVKVQRNWQRLEPIFLASEDIRAQLPDDTKNFEKIDIEWKDMMRDASEDPGVVAACTFEGREALLNEFSTGIESCEKALNDYLEQKKKIFPRFYFVSNQALLDILSNGNNPEKVDEYLGDCFDGMKSLDFLRGEDQPVPAKSAKGMWSKEKEYVSFGEHIFTCTGAVENYLCDLEARMRFILREILEVAKGTADNWDIDKKRHEWLEDYCAQIALLATQIIWTEEVIRAFEEVEGGSETAMKDYLNVILIRLKNLIDRVRTDLSAELRIKIITIITIDVHERDVVDMLVNKKIQDSGSFAWQQQLKFYWDYKSAKEDKKTCIARICDWTTYNNYEYVGNCGRLVITPLTDRCYITLTQALNLTMGGAPAGPAGTGKTETVKDLGRALGLQVVVFNCSDQMNYQSMAQIFMGLSQNGCWGCFDEFNRISIEVLSVVSTQVKMCLDALREMKANPAKNVFNFLEDEITLRITVGFFITMNPGYAGRTELPENLKALFRSCAMVVPDIVLICENMLMSEGFTSARELSKKFMTLYDLAKSLLSKQIHYDWGLRAVKSVLRQAGKLKRADPDIQEDPLLMRALRDFNWPKIIVDDRQIFLGLIRDLFPGIDAEPKINEVLNSAVNKVARKFDLQPEEGFILKCVQLAEILEVRHCCFIIGNPGCSKTTVWKMLAEAYTSQGQETIYDIADPKAVTSDELFGSMNPKTKEWKDGVLSVIMRDMNKNNGRYRSDHFYKWIILDGDVDPEWIESCNTVMDDNKVLTLVSQERIPLTPEMRMLLEVSHLKNATPATVSRGGVLFINDSDVGWKPYFESWMSKYKKKNDEIAINVFTLSLSQYVSDSFLEDLKGREKIAPVCDMGYIKTLTTLVDQLYNELYTRKDYHDFIKSLKEQGREDDIKNIYEAYFIFAVMWSYGASLTEDKISFNNILKSTARVKFPEQGQCFDYFYDPLQLSWIHWSMLVKKYEATDQLFNNIVVPTAETTRQRYILNMHVKARKGVLYVGSAGTGKTTIIKDFFSTLDKEYVLNASISFNSYTDSKALQVVIESNVDKRAGRTFGPPPNKCLIYFMDDLNMPYVDKYGTQSPICLIRQIIDYGLIYDRDHLEEKKLLVDVMFAACMNPKSGSFYVDLRLTRHLSLFAMLTAEKEILITIYQQILSQHLQVFEPAIANMTEKLVNATQQVFTSIATSPQFMPTARKFHYQFNLRDFSKIIQNLMLSQPSIYRGNPLGIVRMWAHEIYRVFYDRLITDEDRDLFMNFMRAGMKNFESFKEEAILEQPLIYTSFVSAAEGHDVAYIAIKEMAQLKNVLEMKLEEYNDQVSTMNLVLFDQAMEHIARICRIIDLPVGNALLVGVGGSGKQSLAKLSSFILGYDVFRIVVTSSYNMNDLKTDIQGMFTKAGVAGAQILFILTDSQITNDKFLVYINDILSSGWIPELFPKEDMDGILGKVRAEAKSAGFMDTPDQLFDFFLDKVRKNLHLCLCFSPVGDAFRFRARKFPAIINCTSMDWFHEWPRDALIDVAQRFLQEVELPNEEIRAAIGVNMAEVHLSIADANKEFLRMERRYNYTTPTSFLELISFYKLLLDKKRDKITDQINRLEIGLQTMKSTTEQVEGLQKLLEVKMVDVEKEKEKTNELIEIVGRESLEAEREQDAAKVQEDETTALANQAEAEKAKANKELEEAIPAMKAAEEAVACLDKKSIQELKALTTPPSQVLDVAKGVLLLRGEKKNFAWQNAQKIMNNPQKFIEEIQSFDGNNIDEWILTQLAPIIAQDYFNFEVMKGKSLAAAYLCKWINNIVIYNRIYKRVKPLMDTAEEAERLANEKKAELAIVLERVRVINEKVDGLKQKLEEAEDQKRRVVEEAQSLQDQLDLANRLVGGLADENKRWGENVNTYKGERITMIGDALVSAAFVSYIGPFSFNFRANLWKEQWLPDIEEKKIPFTNGVDPLKVLATDSDQAKWKTEGLPADRVSLENASVIVSCKRYPLLIDPQLQGQKWIRGKEGNELKVIQLSQKGWLKTIELAVTNGNILMIEALGQSIDAVLDPLLSRQFVKKGKMFTVRLGSEDVEIHPQFKLYLQTKLFNPHYKPETAAQCTIINFIVTESGLEDQLLAMVVKVEKPDLEQQKEELVNKQNEFQIQLAKLEDDLLKNLSDADPATILHNKELIESLEVTKKTSTEIQKQQVQAVETEKKINISREIYRRVAAEGAMLYFLLITLCIVDHMYQYSLESFQTFFFKAIEKTEEFEEDEQRVLALREMIRMTIYRWVSRGLFEKHKQIFLSQVTFRLMQKQIIQVDYSPKEMSFLLRCPIKTDTGNPLKEWLPDLAWYSIQRLIEIDGFELFSQHLEREAPNRFKDWYNELMPENEKLPLDWKKLESMPFQKLLVIRCLRPDRITTALDNFIRRTLPNGSDYVDCDSTSSFQQILQSAHSDSTPTTPIFFILSPGANPVKDVEILAKKCGVDPNKQLHTIALGQGQDVVAMNKLEIGHKEGHWVMLQNIHLMPSFLLDLEKKLDVYAVEGSHSNFRLYLSSDPSDSIPIGLLERSIKLTNEPPQGLKQNMKRAFTFFTKEDIEDKDPKIKTILFGLCYFHSVMIERRKFGPKGWNMHYPFNMGDLRDSAIVLQNYMENNAASGKIPWDDLRYIFGEIMYGGHIVDDWDRRFCAAYLENLMQDTLLDEAELFPFIEGKNITFKCPAPLPYEKYIEYIETETPGETPLAFGMHPNAEIDFRTNQCNVLCRILVELQPKDATSGGEGGAGTKQEKIQEFMHRVNDEVQLEGNKLNIEDIASKMSDDRGPYQNVFLQECECMNALINEIIKSLQEIELSFKGELTMTEKMEMLMDSIFLDKVPASWAKLAFPSTRGLGSWLDNLKHRLDQLNIWKEDPTKVPTVIFLNRLFNPQSFLTAIKQINAREKMQELNRLYIQTDITKKLYWEQDLPNLKEGAYVFGFQVEGARWETSVGQLEESLPKKQFSVVPVVNCRAQLVPADGKEEKGVYQCPCYKTETRGATYVFTAQLKTKQPPQKWILAGVALILDVEGVSDAYAPGKEVGLQ